MESDNYKFENVDASDLSVYSDDVVQAQKYEFKRQAIDEANRPVLPRIKSQHCKDCNLYLDGRNMTVCDKLCCDSLWYRYNELNTEIHPLLVAVYHKQADSTWILHKTLG
jgi:hypothetical protein